MVDTGVTRPKIIDFACHCRISVQISMYIMPLSLPAVPQEKAELFQISSGGQHSLYSIQARYRPRIHIIMAERDSDDEMEC